MSALLAIAIQLATRSPSSHSAASQTKLDAIADACRAPREWFALDGDRIIFRASPDDDQAKVACALEKISAIIASSGRSDGNKKTSEEK